MRDKLTKKRIKVDYCLMISYLNLDKKFIKYLFSRNSDLSIRRQALAFLRSNKVDIESTYFDMKKKSIGYDGTEAFIETCEPKFKDNVEDFLL